MSNKASLAVTGSLIEPQILRELQTKPPINNSGKQRISINYLPIQRKATISPTTSITTITAPLQTVKPRHICKLANSLEDLSQLQSKEKKSFEVNSSRQLSRGFDRFVFI
jgi:hypothetical protein